jgi:hypothetical protein
MISGRNTTYLNFKAEFEANTPTDISEERTWRYLRLTFERRFQQTMR